MKINSIIFILSFILLFSCATVETKVNPEISSIEIDENKKFLTYLENDWQKTLDDNPLFASYTGDKRNNNKISSNDIDNFNKGFNNT